jgi:hypothetical protein
MKKIVFGLLIVVIAFNACAKKTTPPATTPPNSDTNFVGGGNANRDFKFSGGKISKEVLNNYLVRAVTQAEFLSSDGFYNDGPYPNPEDDERMLLNIGAKFVGRSLYSWAFETHFNNPQWLLNAKAKVDRMHQKDPDIIFQAAIFEIVTTKVNQVAIPDWVFTAFNKTPETRNFNMDEMKNVDGVGVNRWGNGTIVPDITRVETRMFFYFMAVKYMEVGIEAIHLGQVTVIAMGDIHQNYAGWNDFLSKAREAAKTKARRGTVLFDGHVPNTANIAVNGHLLFDFGSFPLRLKQIEDQPEKGQMQKFYYDAVYGRTVGGITPSGWSCIASPYIVEFDNTGISDHPGVAKPDWYIWGYDEISWFYKQDETYRNFFLRQIVDYLQKNDPIGFVEMPGSRVVTLPDHKPRRYRCNTQSPACPNGMSQEETIKEIWGN